MAKKKTNLPVNKIPVEDIVEGGVYKTYTEDIVKVLKIDHDTKKFTLRNVTGGHKSWTEFKYIWLTQKLYQSR